MVLFTVPRRHNLYTFSLNDFSSQGNITCLLAKASRDESTKWHRRLGHVNFKNMNKLVTGNLVRGLPSKLFQNDHTCVACNKGKQHKASTSRSQKHIPIARKIYYWDLTVTAPQRFVISSDSSHHSGTHIAETEADSLFRSSAPAMTIATTVTVTAGAATVVKETVAKPSLFATGSSVGKTEPIPGSFLTLLIVMRWWMSLPPPPKFFTSVYGMEHDQLFAEFNVGVARQMTLSAKVRMRAEYNIKEKRRLKSVVDDQAEVLKVKEKEMEDLKAQLLLKEAEVAEAIRLHVEASKFEAAEKSLQDEIQSLKERNAALEKKKGKLDVRVVDLAASVKDERMKEVNDKFDKLDVDVIEMALHLEERFYPQLL
ncbi:gypsy type transposase [Tanacetum coccineum]